MCLKVGFNVGGPCAHAQYEQRVLVSKGPRVGRAHEARLRHPIVPPAPLHPPTPGLWLGISLQGQPLLRGLLASPGSVPLQCSQLRSPESLGSGCTEGCSSPGPQTPAWYPAWRPLICDPISAHPVPLPGSPVCSHLDSDTTALPHVGCLAAPPPPPVPSRSGMCAPSLEGNIASSSEHLLSSRGLQTLRCPGEWDPSLPASSRCVCSSRLETHENKGDPCEHHKPGNRSRNRETGRRAPVCHHILTVCTLGCEDFCSLRHVGKHVGSCLCT